MGLFSASRKWSGTALVGLAGLLVAAVVLEPALAQGKRQTRAAKAQEARHDPEVALQEARKALAANKLAEAEKLADKVLTDDKRDPRNTARALAVRGEVRLRQQRLAEAISDLDNALWVKGGLAGGERDAAVGARAKAYQLAGIGGGSQAPAQVASSAPAPARTTAPPVVRQAQPVSPPATRAKPPEVAWSATTTRATRAPDAAAVPASQQTSSGGGIGAFFANLFNGGAKSATATTPASSAGAAPRVAATSSFTPQTGPADALPLPRRKPATARAISVPGSVTAMAGTDQAASAVTGGYRLQLAAVRTRGEAESLAQQVQQSHASALKGRELEIVEAVFGNMGRFFRPQFGPFASLVESQALCSSIRNSGRDCMVVQR